VTQNDDSIFSGGLGLLLRHYKLLLFLAFAGGLAGIAVSYLFTPVFKAETTLVSSDEVLGLNQNSIAGGLGGLASLVGFGGAGNRQNEALAILKSRALTSAYIEANDLLPIIFHDRWDADKHRWKSYKKGEVPTLEDGFTAFDKGIRLVVENRKTGLIVVSVTWRDPALAKQWVDGLVNSANDLLRRQAIERSTANLEYLQKVLDKTTVVTMKDTISKLMETELKKQMMATGNKDYAFRFIDPAVIPEHKAAPKRSIFALFGAATGSLIWLLMVSFRNRNGTGKVA
jgi:uncharacterized protein involved in exopolysaccharide biosynthesis